MLRKIKVDKDDVIYWEGDFSEEIYFIKQGKVYLYGKNSKPFNDYKDGEMFGSIEVIFKEPRDGKAVAQTDSVLYTISKDELAKLFLEFPDMLERLKVDSEK
jgi:CRP-like cAMP-binding protein